METGERIRRKSPLLFLGENDGPQAEPDVTSTPEDTKVTINVLDNDSDPEGDPLTVCEAEAENGMVTINPDGTITYMPNDNFNGEDVITYTIKDPDGETSTTTVTVEVTPVNDPPVAEPDSTETPEDTPVTINVLENDSDPDGDPLTVCDPPVANNGTVVVNPDGTITYTPDEDFNGQDIITYTIKDPDGETSTTTVTVDVTPVNDPPEIDLNGEMVGCPIIDDRAGFDGMLTENSGQTVVDSGGAFAPDPGAATGQSSVTRTGTIGGQAYEYTDFRYRFFQYT